VTNSRTFESCPIRAARKYRDRRPAGRSRSAGRGGAVEITLIGQNVTPLMAAVRWRTGAAGRNRMAWHAFVIRRRTRADI
jgi:hypothetical protein